jgi:hypothetical protein
MARLDFDAALAHPEFIVRGARRTPRGVIVSRGEWSLGCARGAANGGDVGGLASGAEVAGDGLRLRDEGKQAHAAAAGGALENVDLEGAREEVGPRGVGAGARGT